MSLIDGIGDEVTHFFLGLLTVIVVTIAWWTTNIAEQRHVRTVLLLERRRNRTHRRLTNHTESVTITDGTGHLAPVNEESSIEDINMEQQPDSATASSDTCDIGHRSREEDNIIDSMDNDTTILRQRRVAFYNNWSNENQGTSQTDVPTSVESNSVDQSYSSTTETVADQAGHEVVMEHNYAEYPSTSKDDAIKNKCTQNENKQLDGDNSGITIKLKYINDDLKLVEGKLNEQLGDFKKRHFQPELSANKLVRLIFNGQILQPDTQTLATCGLFDNCVVHCLIHQKRTITESTDIESRRDGYSFQNAMPNLTNIRDWDLGNYMFAFVSLLLLAAWYFRYVYAHLYTVTATVGLILLTGLFTILLLGMYFPDNEPLPNPAIRIARERLHPEQ